MSKYKWLQSYQQLEQEIAELEFELKRYKREWNRWLSGDLSLTPITNGSRADYLESIIAEHEYALAEKMNDLADMKRLIRSFAGLENKILYKHHVEGKKLHTVADELERSPNYIYNKHAEIMKRIKYAEYYQRQYENS